MRKDNNDDMKQPGNPVTTTVSVFPVIVEIALRPTLNGKDAGVASYCTSTVVAKPSVSAKSRSWEQVELAFQAERDKRDPIKQKH